MGHFVCPKHPEDSEVWLVFSETAYQVEPGIRQDVPSLDLIGSLGGSRSLAAHTCQQPDLRLGSSARMRASSQTWRAIWPCPPSPPHSAAQVMTHLTCTPFSGAGAAGIVAGPLQADPGARENPGRDPPSGKSRIQLAPTATPPRCTLAEQLYLEQIGKDGAIATQGT
jgi:hypothetical protein